MYALIELIESENVMFHSGAPLIGLLSVTRLARQLQTRAMRLGPDPQRGVSVVGVSDRVYITVGVSASWERRGRNWRTNYRFWLILSWLMEDEGTEHWQI